MQNDNYRLVVRRGPQPNQSFELNKDVMTLGRDITNDIVINDREVSRHHMRLTRGAGGFSLEDLGSTNGTFVNGKRITGITPLNNGDIIGLGETVTLVYELARGAQPPLSAPSAPRPAEESPSAPPYSAANPYQPPRQEPPAAPYQAPPPYQQPPYSAPPAGTEDPQAPYYSPTPIYGGPPPAPPAGGYGYDYDPYVMREDAPNNTMRYVLIGCVALLFVCCCLVIVAAVLVDQLDLYCQLPLVGDVVQALGLKRCF